MRSLALMSMLGFDSPFMILAGCFCILRTLFQNTGRYIKYTRGSASHLRATAQSQDQEQLEANIYISYLFWVIPNIRRL